jgi:hypothetical protein
VGRGRSTCRTGACTEEGSFEEDESQARSEDGGEEAGEEGRRCEETNLEEIAREEGEEKALTGWGQSSVT